MDGQPMQYGKGGIIAPGTMVVENTTGEPIMMSRGHTLMSLASYRALGGAKGVEKVFPNSDVELVYTAADVKEFGKASLERILQRINQEPPPETVREDDPSLGHDGDR